MRGAGRRRPCRRRRARGLRHRAVAADAAQRTDRGDRAAGRRLQGAARRHGGTHLRRDRRPDQLREDGAGPAAPDHDVGVLRHRRRLPVAAGSSRSVRQRHSDHQTTGRSRGRDRAVEHAAVPDRREGGAGTAGRVLGGAQTRARVGPRRAAARRPRRRSRPAARRAQCGPRRARRRRAVGQPRWRGQGVVHRLHRGWAPGRARLRGGLEAGQPRTRREVGGHRAR